METERNPLRPEIYRNLKHNFIVNLLDGGFFGFALGFASFVTILPLFVSRMTDSALLIGLVPAIHSTGWQLPQLLMVDRIARQKTYRPTVLWMTIQERLPFLGLAVVAWMLPRMENQAALAITYALLIWQGLGGGVTAAAWQSMIGKIIPSDRRGTFYGSQSAAANLLSSIGAIAAGFILETLPSPQDFVICFLITSAAMAVSWVFLSMTREPESPPLRESGSRAQFWAELRQILARDANFRWFLAARMLSQLAIMAFSFYTVYAVSQLGMSEISVGLITGVYLGAQIVSNPVLGWIGDRWGHRLAMVIGASAAFCSALLAWWAPGPGWFYLVFTLAGIANASVWAVGLAMTLEFGRESERPAYIGLANTLIAPATILAPTLGGVLADAAGYPVAFLTSALGGLITLGILIGFLRDPRTLVEPRVEPAVAD